MRSVAVALAALVAGLSGCTSPARYVEKTADAGVVAIPKNTDVWPSNYHSEAVELIKKHVGPNYEIVEEREVPVTTVTNTRQQVDRETSLHPLNPFRGPGATDTVTNTTATTDITEWRITYRRRAAPPAGPVPAGEPFPGGTTLTPATATPPGPAAVPVGGR
jgi:hypothetical protein